MARKGDRKRRVDEGVEGKREGGREGKRKGRWGKIDNR